MTDEVGLEEGKKEEEAKKEEEPKKEENVEELDTDNMEKL